MLSQEQRNIIAKLLQEGNELPEDMKYLLFPTTQKEYELNYAGKIRKEDLLANDDGVFPVPLQVDKVFNGSEHEAYEDGWKNMIVFGDNLQFLKTIYENKDPLIKDKVKGKIKLIYIDPPFATSNEFRNKDGAKAYNDKKMGAEFIEFLRRRLILAREILADDGSIYVHLDYRNVHYIKIVLDEIFDENKFINEITWKRTSAHNDSGKYGINTEYILYYSKTGKYTWNGQYNNYSEKHLSRFRRADDDGRVWTDGPLTAKGLSGGGYTYTYKGTTDIWRCPLETMERLNKENRLHFTNKGGIRVKKYLDELPGTPLQALWDDIDPINSQSKERVSYPTQKPEELLKRVILASTNENDLIMDCFAGSGTTASVAEKLGRKWISCDIGKLSYYTLQKRILQISNTDSLVNKKQKKDKSKKFNYGKNAKSFLTAQLGVYDLKKTFDLKWEEYKNFISGLFEINIQPNKISGLEFEGKKGEYPVKIFDYRKFKDSSVDSDYLKEIHSIIGSKVSGRIYIIAPSNYVDFIADYHEIDSIRYYFLKVPYQIIKELHKTDFQKLRQPQSKKDLNSIDEVIGFHFIKPPEVKSRIVVEDDKIKIHIEDFKSKYYRDDKGIMLDKFESLSAVFLDKSYNDKSFELDEVYFADDLLINDSTDTDVRTRLKDIHVTELAIPQFNINDVGKKIMVIYTDIYGNDFTEIFTVPERR